MLKAKKGFSLIELLVVIAIIGVLSAVGITAYSGYTADAKVKVTVAQHKQVVAMINAESAKCAGGDTTTNFVWDTAALTATCSSTWAVADILAYVNLQDGGLGMSNAFDKTVIMVSSAPTTTAGSLGSSFIQLVAGAIKVSTCYANDCSTPATDLEVNTIARY